MGGIRDKGLYHHTSGCELALLFFFVAPWGRRQAYSGLDGGDLQKFGRFASWISCSLFSQVCCV